MHISSDEKNSKTVSFQKNDIYRLDPQFEILRRTVAHFVGEDSGHFKSSDVRKCALSLSAQRLLMLGWQTLADTWVIVCGEDPGMLMNNTFFWGGGYPLRIDSFEADAFLLIR